MLDWLFDWYIKRKVKGWVVRDMKPLIISRYKPKTLKVKVGDKALKTQIAVHFGCLFGGNVVPLEVWSGGVYHGAGLVDVGSMYFFGDVHVCQGTQPLTVTEFMEKILATDPMETTYVSNLRLEPNTEYTFKLSRPPAPPAMEYDETPLLHYFALTLSMPDDGWELG